MDILLKLLKIYIVFALVILVLSFTFGWINTEPVCDKECQCNNKCEEFGHEPFVYKYGRGWGGQEECWCKDENETLRLY